MKLLFLLVSACISVMFRRLKNQMTKSILFISPLSKWCYFKSQTLHFYINETHMLCLSGSHVSVLVIMWNMNEICVLSLPFCHNFGTLQSLSPLFRKNLFISQTSVSPQLFSLDSP